MRQRPRAPTLRQAQAPMRQFPSVVAVAAGAAAMAAAVGVVEVTAEDISACDLSPHESRAADAAVHCPGPAADRRLVTVSCIARVSLETAQIILK